MKSFDSNSITYLWSYQFCSLTILHVLGRYLSVRDKLGVPPVQSIRSTPDGELRHLFLMKLPHRPFVKRSSRNILSPMSDILLPKCTWRLTALQLLTVHECLAILRSSHPQVSEQLHGPAMMGAAWAIRQMWCFASFRKGLWPAPLAMQGLQAPLHRSGERDPRPRRSAFKFVRYFFKIPTRTRTRAYLQVI